MSVARPRFSIAVHLYLWGSLSLLAFLPLYLVAGIADRRSIPAYGLELSMVWPILIALLFWYAGRRCSSEKMPFQEGLLWVTRSMITGWMVQSFIILPPALLAAFVSSVAIAGYGDVHRSRDFAPAQWLRVVQFFYRHRMRQ